jgi:transposase-like protein
MPRAKYTEDFKRQAVAMAESDGLGIAEAARRLSMPAKTLANWVKPQRGRTAAGRGHAEARAKLGDARAPGEGVEKDKAKTVKWYWL